MSISFTPHPDSTRQILNVSAYRFTPFCSTELPTMRQQIKDCALRCELKGTVLLASEGINLYVAGMPSQVEAFIAELENTYPQLAGLHYKPSWSEHRPYTRMLVRIKRETISFDIASVQPEKHTAEHLSPQQLADWYAQEKDMLVLDTRNDYEVKLGTFKNALDLNIHTFKEFIPKVNDLPEEYKKKPVVTFCTGGIRCEKAAEYMLQVGFEEVYQLDGGILNYFSQCAGQNYVGDCFVFDKRVALNPELDVTDAQVCYSCRMPLQPGEFNPQEQACPLCAKSRFGKENFSLAETQESIKQVTAN